jgi:hypothetical protein
MTFRLEGMSSAGVGAAVAIAIMTAELADYVFHRVMCSERFPVLSRAHTIRHFELFSYLHDRTWRDSGWLVCLS